MEAADDLIIEKSAGGITRTDLKNLSPEALQNLRLEFAPDIMARFFKRKLAGGGMIGLTDDMYTGKCWSCKHTGGVMVREQEKFYEEFLKAYL